MDTQSKKADSHDNRGLKIGNFNCIQYPDQSVQLIYNHTVRNVQFGRTSDGEIVAKLSNGTILRADKEGNMVKV